MTVKIDKRIKGYSVVCQKDETRQTARSEAGKRPDEEVKSAAKRPADVVQMHERIERPNVLVGSTYKIKSPLVEHAMYVTINDIVLNAGTEHELRRPFEIFINSKSMEHFQWIVALTRIMSAVFRKGGDVTFLVEEMKAVFDPKGGYFKGGGVYMPSLIAELGTVVEDHLKTIGLLRDPDLSDEQRALIAEKRRAYDEQSQAKKSSATAGSVTSPGEDSAHQVGATSSAAAEDLLDQGESADALAGSAFPPSSTMCQKCFTKAVIIMDGCATCLSCGQSKCG